MEGGWKEGGKCGWRLEEEDGGKGVCGCDGVSVLGHTDICRAPAKTVGE